MHIFALTRTHLMTALDALTEQGHLPAGLDTSKVTVEPPRESSHGQVATNAAMVLAKEARLAPPALAQLIVSELKKNTHVVEATMAGPGFINISLRDDLWCAQLPLMLREGRAYGTSAKGEGVRVNVEYVSVNPTGPMHMGHARNAVFGDALSSLLKKCGYQVTREYYINDAGGQADQLARSLYWRYQQACGVEVGEAPYYRGDYLIPTGQALAEAEGKAWLDQPESAWLPHFRAKGVDAMMVLIRQDLAQLGIYHDVFTSEKHDIADKGKVDTAFKVLQDMGLIYHGVLEQPKGKVLEDWEPRPQDLFKSTAFGDDVDRALKKSDGSWTYLAPDIAYHYDKFQRGAELLIDILGADHVGYVKRIQAAVQAITEGQAKLKVLTCQLVKFIEGGQALKMSKRAGVFVTVREAVEKLGKDVIRFVMLTRKNDAPLDFDFQAALEQSKENPVFYVQYAHARCASILRHFQTTFPDIDPVDTTLAARAMIYTAPEDLQLIRLLASWPRQVETAAEAMEPHRLAYFAQEVAAAFHALWNKGKETTQLRFIFPEDAEASLHRLVLVRATALVLASILDILGVTPLEELRA